MSGLYKDELGPFEVHTYRSGKSGPLHDQDHTPVKMVYSHFTQYGQHLNKDGVNASYAVVVKLPKDFHQSLESSNMTKLSKEEIHQSVRERGLLGAIEWKRQEWDRATPKYIDGLAKKYGWTPAEQLQHRAEFERNLDKAFNQALVKQVELEMSPKLQARMVDPSKHSTLWSEYPVVTYGDRVAAQLEEKEKSLKESAALTARRSQSASLWEQRRYEVAWLSDVQQRHSWNETERMARIPQDEKVLLQRSGEAISAEFRAQLEERQKLYAAGKYAEYDAKLTQHLQKQEPELTKLALAREAHVELIVATNLAAERQAIYDEHMRQVSQYLTDKETGQSERVLRDLRSSGLDESHPAVAVAKEQRRQLVMDGLCAAWCEREPENSPLSPSQEVSNGRYSLEAVHARKEAAEREAVILSAAVTVPIVASPAPTVRQEPEQAIRQQEAERYQPGYKF